VVVGVAALDGGGASRQQPRSSMQQRSYGAQLWPTMDWVVTWSCADSELVDPSGSTSVDLVATSGKWPQNKCDIQGLQAVCWVVGTTRDGWVTWPLLSCDVSWGDGPGTSGVCLL
jgi:hypothetical protein